jgi:hypothetical protein
VTKYLRRNCKKDKKKCSKGVALCLFNSEFETRLFESRKAKIKKFFETRLFESRKECFGRK